MSLIWDFATKKRLSRLARSQRSIYWELTWTILFWVLVISVLVRHSFGQAFEIPSPGSDRNPAEVRAELLSLQPKPTFSKRYVFTQLALETADAVATYRAVGLHNQWGYCHEINPIASPFVNHGPKALSFYFAAEAVSKIGLVYWLHRRHPRLEKWAKISALSSSAAGASYSFARAQ